MLLELTTRVFTPARNAVQLRKQARGKLKIKCCPSKRVKRLPAFTSKIYR